MNNVETKPPSSNSSLQSLYSFLIWCLSILFMLTVLTFALGEQYVLLPYLELGATHFDSRQLAALHAKIRDSRFRVRVLKRLGIPVADKATPQKQAPASQEKVKKIIKLSPNDSLISEGKSWEEKNNYFKAYRCYAKAAAAGSEIGALNCATLLASRKYTARNKSRKDISFLIARKYASQVAETTKHKNLRGVANNILGVIYNKGGAGLRANRQTAIKYFKIAAQCGDEHAQKNLRAMRVPFR